MRSRLRSFRDERGRELLDLPDAPRPDPATPAPPRFLPEYDNVLLAHADRSRILVGNQGPPAPPGNGGSRGSLLVDGAYRARWECRVDDGAATIVVEPFDQLTAREVRAVGAEGRRLLRFLAPNSKARRVDVLGTV